MVAATREAERAQSVIDGDHYATAHGEVRAVVPRRIRGAVGECTAVYPNENW